MKSALALITALLLAFLPLGTAYAQTIHAIVAADSNDGTIGQGAGQNAQRLATILRDAAKYSGLKLNLIEVTAGKYDCANILKEIDGLSISATDVVIFYNTGHGYRLQDDSSRFPRLACSKAYYTNPGLQEIAEDLRAKKARLVIAIADSCNTDLGGAVFSAKPDQVYIDAYTTLLTKYTGTLIMSGSDRQQYSFYYTNGGLFSKQLFGAILNEADTGAAARWDNIIRAATTPQEVLYQGKIHIQQPIYLSTLIQK